MKIKYLYLIIPYILLTSCGSKTNLTWIVDAKKYVKDINVNSDELPSKEVSLSWSKITYPYMLFSNDSTLFSLKSENGYSYLDTDFNDNIDSIKMKFYHFEYWYDSYPNNFVLTATQDIIFLYDFGWIGKEDHYEIYAIDNNDNVKWEYISSNVHKARLASFISEFNNDIYFIDSDDILYCLDKTDGRIIWKKELPKDEYKYKYYKIVASKDAIYVLSNRGILMCLDKKNREEKWNSIIEIKRRIEPPLIEIFEKYIFVSGYNETYAVDISTGKVVWSYKKRGPFTLKKIDNNNIYIFNDYEVAVVDVSRLKIKWSRKTSDVLRIYDCSFSRLYKYKVLYTKDSMIHAVDAFSGKELWSRPDEFLNLDRDLTFIYNDVIFSRIKEKRKYYLTMHNIDTGEMINKIGLEELLSGRSILLPKGVSITGYDFKQHKAYYFN